MSTLTGGLQTPGHATSVGTTTPSHPVGTEARDAAGNVYVYLQAGESFVAGEFVTYDDAYIATQVGAASRGPVAVVDGTFTSDEYFWGMVQGTYAAAIGTSAVTSASQLIMAATSDGGYVDESTSTGSANILYGAWARTACSTATSPIVAGLGLFTVQLLRPYVTGLITVQSS